MEKSSVKDVVNQCFSRKGVPKVKNFAAEFADGSKCSPSNVSSLLILLSRSFSSVLKAFQYFVR